MTIGILNIFCAILKSVYMMGWLVYYAGQLMEWK